MLHALVQPCSFSGPISGASGLTGSCFAQIYLFLSFSVRLDLAYCVSQETDYMVTENLLGSIYLYGSVVGSPQPATEVSAVSILTDRPNDLREVKSCLKSHSKEAELRCEVTIRFKSTLTLLSIK